MRRVADVLGRLELGRELLLRLAPGLVLALGAVRGLAEPLPDFLAASDLAVLGRCELVLDPPAVPDRLVLPDLAPLPDLAVLAEPERRDRDLDRVDEDRVDEDRDDAGRDAAGRATDIVFAAAVSALAAVVMALVALFMACIAVDIVLADVLALVAAAVILVAAELTLVAADETVRAAVAGVGLELAEVLRVLRAALLAGLRAVVVRRALVPVRRAVLLRDVLAEVLRVDPAELPRVVDVAPVARAVALVLGRPAERLEALVLIDRVRLERAGVRRAVALAVVCTGTDSPPS